MNIQDTLKERNKTHGEFEKNATISQALKFAMRSTTSWNNLQAQSKESLDLIATKISRILSNTHNPNIDNWHDIAGYATLVENMLTNQEKNKI